MDNSGKIIWAHHNEIQTTSVKTGAGFFLSFLSAVFFQFCSLGSFSDCFFTLLPASSSFSSEEIETKDGEKLPLAVKDLGSCEVYPQTLKHNPNGRFVVVCGDGEYIIYTALAWRNKSFGSALEFVWASDSNQFAFSLFLFSPQKTLILILTKVCRTRELVKGEILQELQGKEVNEAKLQCGGHLRWCLPWCSLRKLPVLL